MFRARGRSAPPSTEVAMRMRALPIAAVLVLTACGGSTGAGSGSGSPAGSSGRGISGPVTVFAAASLTDVFTQFGKDLEHRQPGLHVRFNFAGSSALATQIAQGAPVDVFASANQAQMKVVTDAGLQAGDPTVFTENVLEIAVPRGNPGHVTGIRGFADPDLTLAVCAPAVPRGAAAPAGVTAARAGAPAGPAGE